MITTIAAIADIALIAYCLGTANMIKLTFIKVVYMGPMISTVCTGDVCVADEHYEKSDLLAALMLVCIVVGFLRLIAARYMLQKIYIMFTAMSCILQAAILTACIYAKRADIYIDSYSVFYTGFYMCVGLLFANAMYVMYIVMCTNHHAGGEISPPEDKYV